MPTIPNHVNHSRNSWFNSEPWEKNQVKSWAVGKQVQVTHKLTRGWPWEQWPMAGNNNIGRGFQKHWQGTTSFPQCPGECNTPVNYDHQELATSKYSFTIEPDADDDVMHQWHLKCACHVTGPSILASFTKKLISWLCKKLSQTL